jgi:hypothetical protein
MCKLKVRRVLIMNALALVLFLTFGLSVILLLVLTFTSLFLVLWSNGILLFFVNVPPEVIYLQLCTPKVICI